MIHLGLFEGIGGFALAAEWAGWETVAYSEIDPYCNRVLAKNFPGAEALGDIKEIDFTRYADIVNIITGGDPCQPHSKAGKQLGIADIRYLWPEMLRSIREARPNWVVNENVRDSISNGVLDQKIRDLENLNYTCWPPLLIPAGAGEALCLRERIWLVARADKNANGNDTGKIQSSAGKSKNNKQRTDRERLRPIAGSILTERNWTKVASELCRDTIGLRDKLDRNGAIGNAIDPRIAFEIFNAINQYELTA